MASAALLSQLLLYILAVRFVVARTTGAIREILFAGLAIAGCYYFLAANGDVRYSRAFAAYIFIVLIQYAALRLFGGRQSWKPWIAFFTPLLFLIVIRYTPISLLARFSSSARAAQAQETSFTLTPYFIGISYLSFRTSHMVLEIRNGAAKMPGLWEYLGYCFFLPTMPVGPINPYSNFRHAFEAAPPTIPAGRAILRIIVGLIKYKFLGSLLDQLSYSGLLLDGYKHPWIDLPIAVVFYYLFLYCNFSGFCDMAIGAAGLMGIPVAENFDNPFAARNVKDFWNRWHITLSSYMRDVVFSPLSKFFVHLFGPANASHAIAATILVVFLLIGAWHGVGWNYALYGAAHALGVIANHYYTIGLKKWLGRDRFKSYNTNPWIHAGAVSMTFCYCAASLFLFANTFAEMRQILDALR